jgi:ATP-dependent DNA helicase RecG
VYTLDTPISAVQGVGATLSQRLHIAGVTTVRDLVLFAPYRYEHRQNLIKLIDLLSDNTALFSNEKNSELVTVQAQVVRVSQSWRGKQSMQRATISDETGQFKANWFNSPFVIRQLQSGASYNFSGKWSSEYRCLTQPTIEELGRGETLHTGRIVPMYSSSLGIKPGWMRRVLHQLFTKLEPMVDPLSHQCDWCHDLDLNSYLKKLHFPESEEDAILARRRLALEELLMLLAEAQHSQHAWQQQATQFSLPNTDVLQALQPLIQRLPFKLTTDQRKAIQDIATDLSATFPMNRLLQGDVGVGKTIVAGLVAHLLVEQGQSVCLLAPTKILAEQHQQSLSQQLPTLPTQLVSAQTSKTSLQKNPTMFIGTHALLNKFLEIHPALVIYDEQQRFGVTQRGLINSLERIPHVLTMTATPIPRSLMLTVFSHLSRSVIETLPAGRKATKTWYVPSSKQSAGWQWVAEQLASGDQLAIVVCPFIESSDAETAITVSATEATFQELQQRFPHLRIAQLHGKHSLATQQKVVAQAHAGELDILVATAIVEVGVDLPQASIMVILSTERFGLASLHQLRGRVGRRGQQGYCLLMSTAGSAQTASRLRQFAQLTSGAEVAELDLSLRGPGDLLGTDQHGYELFQFASWVDRELLTTAQTLSQHLSSPFQSQLFPTQHSNQQLAHN